MDIQVTTFPNAIGLMRGIYTEELGNAIGLINAQKLINDGHAIEINSVAQSSGQPYGSSGDGLIVKVSNLPTSGTLGTIYQLPNGVTYTWNGSAFTSSSGSSSVDKVAITASRNTNTADDGDILTNSTASNYTVTIAASTVPNGLVLQQVSTGTVTVAAGAGVTLIGSSLVTAGAGTQLSLIPTATVNTFIVASSVFDTTNLAKLDTSNQFAKSQQAAISTLTFAASIAPDMDKPLEVLTNTGAFTLTAPTNAPATGYFKERLIKVIAGTGAGALTATGYKKVGTLPALATTVGNFNWISIRHDGTHYSISVSGEYA